VRFEMFKSRIAVALFARNKYSRRRLVVANKNLVPLRRSDYAYNTLVIWQKNY